ncbi:protein-lysine 6-oxidase isoform X1 [Fundulus heteroclitus]|uniref:protein-lysine 6-oxidase isoform X1 n=1 Tax=Fundulus heteroclitus TaxID=8078 RepID=UPI00165B8C52|nr:protein-lysine 6-oxidase isoform X1 [Fundulus heteroclitus]
MAKWYIVLLYLLQVLLPFTFGQQRAAAPWRHRIQWQNNGQVHSLLSTGSEYQAPVRSGGLSRVYLSSRREDAARNVPGAHRGAAPVGHVVSYADAQRFNSSSAGTLRDTLGRREAAHRGASHTVRGEPGLGALRAVPERMLVSRQPTQTGRLISAHPPVLESQPEAPAPFPVSSVYATNEADGEGMVNDDPRNPFKTHRNSVFYNMYPTRGRSVGRTRHPPGTGYGTRLFQNGLPDLIPDPYAIQAGTYVQRMQMYALRCAAEENCLARSAYAPGVRDIDFRVLLRFPQKVKNQGTADFLPLKPRYQWDWHSCHQHYHSMDAFSNYDLLDMVSGRKVAEGHKASFCLEDTGCEPGIRRRYACTSHTQGLSPGCHDTYAANIDCQWIDITDVPPGNYILQVTVNPSFHVLESDFTNNVVRCEIIYTGVYVQTRGCRITRS